MKIGRVEKVLIALSITVVLGSFAFAINARPAADAVVVLQTQGMTCSSCAGNIQKTLLSRPGVCEAKVDVAAAQVFVAYDASVAEPEAIAASVTAAGYKSDVVQNLPLERFLGAGGQRIFARAPTGTGGCGSGCCY